MNYNYGVDLDHSLSFQDGDLKLVTYEENISQSIYNRLQTIHDSLDLFYEDYGSFLQSFLGWRRNDKTLNFIKMEVDTVIDKDPRINNFATNVEYTENGHVKITIRLYEETGEDLDLNFILSEEGVSEVEE